MENQTPYTDPFQGERRGLANASLAFGIIAIPAAYLTGIFGCMFGLIAIFFGIFAKGAAKLRSSRSVAGMIFGAIAFVFGLGLFIYALNFMNNNMDELMQMMQGYESFFNRN